MENMKKKTYKVIALTLIIGLVVGSGLGTFVFGAQGSEKAKENKEKESTQTVGKDKTSVKTDDETVYVITQPNGTVKQTIVSESEQLHYGEYDNYKLPVEMKISYKLDGVNVTPKELAGKSGHLVMKINYINNEKRGNVYVPFMAVSGMIFDNENCSNIDVINGKAIDDGNRTTIIGYGLPGMQESIGVSRSKVDLPDTVTITADVKDFSLEAIMTLATNQVFSEMDFDQVKDVSDLKKTIKKLSNGVEELVEGTSKLYEGTKQLKDKSKDLVDGTNKLAEGSNSLYAGTTDLQSGATQLNQGLQQLNANSASLNGGAKQIMDAMVATVDGSLTDLRKAFSQMGKNIPTLTGENYNAVLTEVINTLKAIDAQKGTNNYKAVVASLEGAKKQLDSINQFYKGVVQYTAGVDSAYAGSSALEKGAGQLNSGAKELNAGIKTLAAGELKLIDGIDQLNEGAKALNEGVESMEKEAIKKISKLKDSDLEKVLNRIKDMSTAAKNYKGFGGKKNYDSVKFIYRAEAIGE